VEGHNDTPLRVDRVAALILPRGLAMCIPICQGDHQSHGNQYRTTVFVNALAQLELRELQ
jgi:hypothetical protein